MAYKDSALDLLLGYSSNSDIVKKQLFSFHSGFVASYENP